MTTSGAECGEASAPFVYHHPDHREKPVMTDHQPATGPALAARLGGTFDFDNATVRFEGRSYFVRCGATGKVQLVLHRYGAPFNLGRMSEPLDDLATEFEETLEDLGLTPPGPARS